MTKTACPGELRDGVRRCSVECEWSFMVTPWMQCWEANESMICEPWAAAMTELVTKISDGTNQQELMRYHEAVAWLARRDELMEGPFEVEVGDA